MKKYRVPHRIKKKKSIFRSKFFWLPVLFFVLILAFFYFLFFSATFQIKKITISGCEKIPEEEIRLLAEKNLEGKIFFLKTKSIFSINLTGIEKIISENFVQISKTEISRGFPSVLNILINERVGVANYCQFFSENSEEGAEKKETCFLIDKEGVIFKETELDDKFAKIIKEQSFKFFMLGEKIIEGDLVGKILDIKENLEKLKIKTKEFIISEDRLTVRTLEKWDIYFNASEDMNWQLTKLSVLLEEKIPVTEREKLEYIDLRFGNFAPFKYKEPESDN